jgi:hypothetical protein
MPGSEPQQPRHMLAGMLLVAYLVSFLFPAIRTRDGEELLGFQVFVEGLRSAYARTEKPRTAEARTTESIRAAAGLANPLMWLAFYAFFTQRWLPASALAAGALLLGVGSACLLFGMEIGERLCSGCYLWLSSMLAVALVANWAWRYQLIGH